MSNKNEVFEYLIDQLRQQVSNNQCEDLAHEVLSLKSELARYKKPYISYVKKTDWVQGDSRFLKKWGKHRADILRECIQEQDAEIQSLKNQLHDASALVAELQETIKLMNEDFNRVTNRCGPLPKGVSYVVGEHGPEQSGCRREDTQECDHNWIIAPGLFIAEGHKGNVPGSRFCCECGAREWDDPEYEPKAYTQKCKHEWEYYYPHGEEYRRCAKCGVITE